METKEYAKALMDIPSITGSEKDVLLWLEEYALHRGYRVERNPVTENRWNLFINWDDHSEIVFSTHVDTVPPYIPYREDKDVIFGRGACDTKGIIAAMLSAGEVLMKKGNMPSYLFTVGEEYDSIGAKTAAKTDKTANFIVNGEPTNSMLVKGHKGVLGYILSAKGRTAHSSFPELGISAIDILLDVIQDIRQIEWKKSPLFGESTLNIGLISGGRAKNVVPDAAEATFMHRVVTNPEEMKKRIIDVVRNRVQVDFFTQSNPQEMFVPDGYASKIVPFGTDIPHLRSMGTPLLFGPGDIHYAHSENEQINIAEMNAAVDAYVQLYYELKKYC